MEDLVVGSERGPFCVGVLPQQSTDVSALSSRIAKLNIEGGSPLSTPSRTHERDIVRRLLEVTPHVASTTAALNAEQTASIKCVVFHDFPTSDRTMFGSDDDR